MRVAKTVERKRLESGETFEYKGRLFKFEVERDEDMGAPWKERDGHGIVSEWTRRSKSPGELVLTSDGGDYRYYDLQATLKLALKDGWGVGPEEEARLATQLGRALTKREVVRRAVELDYEYMRRWCRDEWWWVYVQVTLLKEDEDAEEGWFETRHRASLGGIDSESKDYLTEVGYELAGEILHELDRNTSSTDERE